MMRLTCLAVFNFFGRDLRRSAAMLGLLTTADYYRMFYACTSNFNEWKEDKIYWSRSIHLFTITKQPDDRKFDS